MVYAEEMSLIIQQRITGFFNSVKTAEEILNNLIDDPNFGKEHRGIHRKLAEKIFSEREKNTSKKFRQVWQIFEIAGMGQDARHDTIFNFVRVFANNEEKVLFAQQIEKRILRYLNALSNPESLVKKVSDDPTFGASGKGISLKQAQAILSARDKKNSGKFTAISEITEVKGMGKDAEHDLLFTFWLEDEFPPPVSIQSPLDGSCTNATSIDLAVSCYAPSEDVDDPEAGNVSKIEILCNDQLILSYDTPPSKNFFVQRFLNLDVSGGLNKGVAQTFQVRIYKKSQRKGLLATSEKVSVLVDQLAPMIEFTSPQTNGFTNLAKPEVCFTVRDTGGAGVKPQALVTLNGKSMRVRSETVSGDEANFYALPKTNLSEGMQIVHVTASDWAGNSSTRSLEFNVDLSSPRVVLSHPLNGNFYSEVKGISASILETGGAEVDSKSLVVVLDQKKLKSTCTGPLEGHYRIESEVPGELTEGIHKLSISLADTAGNKLQGGEINFGILKSKNYFETAYTWFSQGESLLAENALRYSGDPRSALALGQLLEMQNRSAEAVAVYKNCSLPEAKKSLAAIYMATKNSQELLPLVDEIIRESGNKDALCFKGNLLAPTDMNQAEELWKSADTPRSWYNLACLACSKGNKTEAIAYITKLASVGGAWLTPLSKDRNLALIKTELSTIPKIIK